MRVSQFNEKKVPSALQLQQAFENVLPNVVPHKAEPASRPEQPARRQSTLWVDLRDTQPEPKSPKSMKSPKSKTLARRSTNGEWTSKMESLTAHAESLTVRCRQMQKDLNNFKKSSSSGSDHTESSEEGGDDEEDC